MNGYADEHANMVQLDDKEWPSPLGYEDDELALIGDDRIAAASPWRLHMG